MADMLVRLFDIPSAAEAVAAVASDAIQVRRALVPERPVVGDFVAAHFAPWSAEVDICFARQPVSCFVATRGNELLGFACVEAIARGFFGPTGVDATMRGKGIGEALLVESLLSMRAAGYAYAIIGGVGPAEFYARAVGAVEIAGSTPGIYDGMLFPWDPASGT